MARGTWRRTTTQGTLDTSPELLRIAVLDRAAAEGLDLDGGATTFVTRSHQEGGGLLRRSTIETVTALVLGRRDIVIALDTGDGLPAVLAARAEDLRLDDGLATRLPAGAVSGKFAEQLRQAAADGIDLTGFVVAGEGGPGTYHIGLGEPEGDAARKLIRAAIEEARAR